MISLKKGVLKISHEKDGNAKQIFDICFVINMITIFAFYMIRIVAPLSSIMMLASAILIWVGRRKSKVIIPYNAVWYGVFLLYVALSGLWASYVQNDSIQSILKMAVILITIMSISIYIETNEDLERLMVLYVFSVSVIVVLELLSTPFDSWFNGAFGRNFSNFNSNEFAFLVSCAEMIAFYKFYIKKDYKYIFLVVAFIFVVLLTSSRKATVSVILAPILMMVISTYKKNYLLKIIIVCCIMGFLIYLIMTNENLYNTIGRRFMSMYKFTNDMSSKSDNSMYIRSYFIQAAKEMFAESPLFGKGTRNFAFEIKNEYGIMSSYSHNNYWQILSELGLFGFTIYYSFYLFCIGKLIKNIIVNKSKISILFLSFMLLLIGLEYAMVTFNTKSTHIIIAMVYASTYVGETDGRKYQYIKNNSNDLEEAK